MHSYQTQRKERVQYEFLRVKSLERVYLFVTFLNHTPNTCKQGPKTRLKTVRELRHLSKQSKSTVLGLHKT